MSLTDRKQQMEQCVRCSCCKWVTQPQIRSQRFSGGCPSIDYGNFHTYSAGGKNITGLALLRGWIEYTDEMLRSVHACSMCGNCQISCTLCNSGNVEPMSNIRELRIKIVEDGASDPAHMAVIDGLKKEDNTFGLPRADRFKWAEGLEIKNALEEKVDVYLHVGCQYSYTEELWPILRGAVSLMQEAGVNFGFAKNDEGCCAGRAYEMGYRGEMETFSDAMVQKVKQSGAKTVLTICADCYGTFKQLYALSGKNFAGAEILHFTQLLERLVQDGKLKFREEVPLRAVYHDPCHLGRLGEAAVPWSGKLEKIQTPGMYVTVPEKVINFGTNGIYDAPRNVLKSIPGLDFTEMERIREYAYCCGAGGGAKEAYPDFALKAAVERIQEAKFFGADAIVTACPWCVRNFRDAIAETGENIAVYDMVEITLKAMGKDNPSKIK
ncbi:MAG: (Fe-S)-binding protein [Pseudomonadota bacterium]